MKQRAFYSVMQYVPDGARAEGANVGVVLYLPDTGRIEFRTSTSLARVRKFFSPEPKERNWIESAVKTFESRLKKAQGEFPTETEFARFLAARADAVRATAPKLVVLTQVESTLNELYSELVGDEESQERSARSVSLPSRVAETFGRLEAAKRLWRPGRIVVPESNRKIHIPLAYQNGRVNFILPKSLALKSKPEGKLPTVAFDGLLIHQHPIDDQPSKLIVLSADANADSEVEKHFADVLDDFHVDFVPYRKAEEFAARVEKEAH